MLVRMIVIKDFFKCLDYPNENGERENREVKSTLLGSRVENFIRFLNLGLDSCWFSYQEAEGSSCYLLGRKIL